MAGLPRTCVLDFVRHAVFPAAPARRHPIGRTLQYGFDLMKQAFLNLEQLGNFPGPWLLRSGGDRAAIRRLERAGLAGGMIEEGEPEHEASLLVNDQVTTIPD